MSFNQSINQSINQNILYRADCKEAINHLLENNIKVDLIYLDPPFNSHRVYNIIFQSKGVTAQQKAFHDAWTLTLQNRQLLFDFDKIIEENDEIDDLVKQFLIAWIAPLKEGKTKDNQLLIYLIYMTERLALMKKVLKPTGSIYLHCDPTASHYLKIIMDGIFKRDNFKNEIIWCYSSPSNTKRWFPRKHDIILYYTKDIDWHFDSEKVKVPYVRLNTGSSKHGIFKEDVTLDNKGKVVEDWWTDISPVGRIKKERLGYATQKPLALLDRIIKASCPNGGIILDPFCGCGTTIESAILNNFKWIGCDISTSAIEIIKERIKKVNVFDSEDYIVLDGSPETKNEYNNLNPYEKQDWLINKVGGFPNPKKSGDGGIDGEMTIHIGFENQKDKWGKMIFSVKTGNQCNPSMIRELVGTMRINNAVFGGLLLDVDPTDEMVALAKKQGDFKYQYSSLMPEQHFDKVQILTADEVIDKKKFNTPPSLNEIKLFRNKSQLNLKKVQDSI